MGEFIDVTAKDGGRFRAYLALPPAGKATDKEPRDRTLARSSSSLTLPRTHS